jgi:hypothetical protein
MQNFHTTIIGGVLCCHISQSMYHLNKHHYWTWYVYHYNIVFMYMTNVLHVVSPPRCVHLLSVAPTGGGVPSLHLLQNNCNIIFLFATIILSNRGFTERSICTPSSRHSTYYYLV